MYRTQTFRLHPTAKQQIALQELLDFQREVYNAALEERKGVWRLEGRSVSLYEQQHHLTGWDEPRLKRFGIRATRGTLRRLDRAFQGFFRRYRSGEKPGYPRYKGADRWNSVEWPDLNGWKVTENGRLYLMGVGHVKIAQRGRNRTLRSRPKALVVRQRGRRWEATVFCKVERPNPRPRTNQEIGLDLGIASLVTTSNGEHIENPRWFRTQEERLRTVQRERERHQKGSLRWRRANYRIARTHEKIRNQRRDHHHKLSRTLVNSYDLIVHEDLKIAQMSRRPTPRPNQDGEWDPSGAAQKGGLNKSIQDAGWGQLARMIWYKAEEAGIVVMRVNPQYTSQTCPECGHVAKENRVKQAKFKCLACGHTDHADVNAALNILRLGQSQRGAAQAAEREVPSETTSRGCEAALGAGPKRRIMCQDSL